MQLTPLYNGVRDIATVSSGKAMEPSRIQQLAPLLSTFAFIEPIHGLNPPRMTQFQLFWNNGLLWCHIGFMMMIMMSMRPFEYQAMVWAVPGKSSNPEGFHTKGRTKSAIPVFPIKRQILQYHKVFNSI